MKLNLYKLSIFLLTPLLFLNMTKAQVPVIDLDPPGVKCYNIPFPLKIINPDNTGFLYDWEYWRYGDYDLSNLDGQFETFLSNMCISFRAKYEELLVESPEEVVGVNMDYVNFVVGNSWLTDFSFMINYLDLYEDLSANEAYIAFSLIVGITDQNSNRLYPEEIQFLYSYFPLVAMEQADFPRPFCKLWTSMNENLDEYALSFCNPAVPYSTEITVPIKLAFRARANTGGGVHGEYSNIVIADIVPSPPTTGAISITKSCSGSDIGGISCTVNPPPYNTSDFYYKIVNEVSACRDEGINEGDTGTDINIGTLGDGKYKLCLKYLDSSVGFYYSEKAFEISAYPELTYSATKTDVTCPGGSDAKISVTITQDAGSYWISLDSGTHLTEKSYSFTGLTARSYTISAGDRCKDKSETVTITQPNSVSIIAVNLVQPTCISNPNGGFTINVTGSPAGKYDYYIKDSGGVLIYSELNQNSTLSYNLLSDGNYSINVRDNAHPTCSGVTRSITLNNSSPLGLFVTKTDVKCFGQNTGEIRLTGSGGSGTFKFRIGSDIRVGSSAVYSSLTAGSYPAYLTNNNSCGDQVIVNVTVETNTAITISLSETDVACFDNNDGVVSASVTGGTGGYNLLWEENADGTWLYKDQNKLTISQLYTGDYRLTVTDNSFCSKSAITTVNQPAAPLEISEIIPTDIKCFGESGSIQMTAIGGNGGYSYIWDDQEGLVYSGSSSSRPLPAGKYNLNVTDRKGCEASWNNNEIITITEPSESLDFTYLIGDYNGYGVKCAGDSNGRITVSARGGNGEKGSGGTYNGYSYFLEGRPLQSIPVFTDLPASTYALTITDQRGCSVSKHATITQPEGINLSLVSKDDIKCYGSNTGRLFVNATGGLNGTYTFGLNNQEYTSDPDFINLSPGNYLVTVKDGNSCTQQLSTEIIQLFEEIRVSLEKEDIRCFGENNGHLTSSITGGSGNFDLIWEQKINEEWQFKQEDLTEISGLVPGVYRLKSTDEYGCSAISEITTIQQPEAPLTLKSLTINDIQCFGEKGGIEIEANGGTEGYKYLYSTDDQPYEFFAPNNALSAGTYQFIVEDIKGCKTNPSEKFVITQPQQPLSFSTTIKAFNGFNVSCFGNNDGQIEITSSGGNGNIYTGYSYQLSGRNEQSLPLFKDLTAGNYLLSVTDGRGCTISKPVSLIQDESKIELFAERVGQPNCINDLTGTIELTSTGGVSPYLYSIDNEPFVSYNLFTGLGVNDYHFEVKDANGCLQYFDTKISSKVSKMEVSAIIEDVKCFGENSGKIEATVSGGVEPYRFNWSNTGLIEKKIQNLSKGLYSLKVTDNAGCITEKAFEIKEPTEPLRITATVEAACEGTQSGIILPSSLGGKAPYLFHLNNRTISFNDSRFIVSGGNYTVYATDSNNCKAETNVTVGIRNVMPEINFMAATNRYALDTLVVKDVSLPRPDSVRWIFSPEALLIDNNLLQARVKYAETGIYPVKMTGYFDGCEYSVEKKLSIAPFDSMVLHDNENRTGIKSVVISPNPNTGQFIVNVNLYTKQQVRMKVLDMYSKIWLSEVLPADLYFEEPVNIPDALAGTYVLWVITENDSKALLFIITK